MERESFVFYKSFYTAANNLTPEDKAVLFDAICEYGLYGKVPELQGALAGMFELLKPQLDKNNQRYKNGCKGGRPKTEEEPNENQNKTELESLKPNVNDNVNDNDSQRPRLAFGQLKNVMLSEEERQALKDVYENSDKLINKVSRWIQKAKNEVPDHYILCLMFADNDNWPKRKNIEPVQKYEVVDGLSTEEQQAKVAEMRRRLNGAFASG